MPTVGLYTLGCKVSQYETEAIAEAFAKAGFTVLPYESVCDVYVINTCTVTAESDRKSRQVIRRAKKQNPDAVVCVTGCYAQTSADEVAAIPGVDIVTGTVDKLSLVARAAARLSARGEALPAEVAVGCLDGAPFEKMRITHAPRTRIYVKIEDGCECRCTYCAIPGARGNVRSKRPEDVIAEVEALAAAGTREVVLTGIEAASYGADFHDGYRLIDLVEELDRRGSVERIRFGSLTPELMSEDFVFRMAKLKAPVPHFHLSMQSGSDGVLRRMKRRYNRTQALAALARTRAAMPRVQFTTDLMVGFPGETEEEFAETLDFVRKARFLAVHVFAYSRRKNTPAATFPDQVPEAVKHERSARLIAACHEIGEEILSEIVSSEKALPVVFETREGEFFTGHSDTFIEVRVRDGRDLHGELHTVRPFSHENGILYGEILE
ncbi:MAG TPA: tRNA (N(6)-L-threonylcarbamoyladenosine(37)-C(2))-methylthiotransferase MtaB [Clostridiales bacterium]|nr:tRNA (N(6)-L-threonylcarbamoyladenosine(37)-C(2))-methylthiotransferase MtaB [Clostridiales bacterium]